MKTAMTEAEFRKKYPLEIKILSNYLRHGMWVKSIQIITCTPLSKRMVRRIAEYTGGFISTQKGFKRADLATLDEIHQAQNILTSISDHIEARNRRLDKHLGTADMFGGAAA